MESIKEIEKKIVPILRKYRARRAGFFGSYARGEENKNSDVDILVELDNNFSLLDIIGIKLELEEAVKKKVDLIEYETVRRELKEKVLEDEVPIKL